jgi:hypothetical protein
MRHWLYRWILHLLVMISAMIGFLTLTVWAPDFASPFSEWCTARWFNKNLPIKKD